jgi:uncharacterized cysteine cluster protein YcgN (CxxCxxCC family)
MAMAEDSICLRCGECCRLKARTPSGLVVFTPFRCKHQAVDGHCMVYEHRHSVNPACLTIEEAIVASCLPDTCPYVAGKTNYHGPVDKPELWRNPEDVVRAGRALGATPKEIDRAIAENCMGWKSIPGVNK